MTPKQIDNKIDTLKFWLQANPNHPDRNVVQADLRKLTDQKVNSKANALRTN